MNKPIFTELTTKVFKKKILGTYFVSEQVMNYFFIATHFSLEKTIDSFKMKMEMYPKDEQETLLKETIKETANKNVDNNYIHRNSTERFYVKLTEFKECGEFNIFNLFQDFVINLDDCNDFYKKNDFKPYNYYLKKPNDYYLQNNEIDIHELPEFNSIVTSVVNNFFLLFLKEVKPKEQSKEKSKKYTGFKTDLNKPQIIKLYNKIKGNLISDKTNQANFIAALNNKVLPENFQKIYWHAEESLFCCLFYGYSNLEYKEQSLYFEGLVKGNNNEYIRATSLFDFRTKTTNKTLSSKVAKLSNCNSPQNFELIYPIIEQY